MISNRLTQHYKISLIKNQLIQNYDAWFCCILVGLAVGVPCNSDGVCTSNELHCAHGYVKGCHSGLCTCEHATCKKFVQDLIRID